MNPSYIKCALSMTPDLNVDVETTWSQQSAVQSHSPPGPVLPFSCSTNMSSANNISNFDLGYLALIFRGLSKVAIEGDGVRIRGWHFSVIWHHRQHSQCWCWYRKLVLQHYPVVFTAPEGGPSTSSWIYFSWYWLNISTMTNDLYVNSKKKERKCWSVNQLNS